MRFLFVYDDKDRNDLKFVKKCLSKFRNKKLIINKKNLGVAKSRNIAIKFSKRGLILLLSTQMIFGKK